MRNLMCNGKGVVVMADECKMINIQLFVKWLGIMAKEMEAYPDEMYCMGAAKSYRVVINTMQSGVFDMQKLTKSES